MKANQITFDKKLPAIQTKVSNKDDRQKNFQD